MSDVIWALDTRSRAIACPSKPSANAVVLLLCDDGAVHKDVVHDWAAAGLMVASVAWPGADADLTSDDLLDLEDAIDGLFGLATAVGVAAQVNTLALIEPLTRPRELAYVGEADVERALKALLHIAPV